MSKRLIRIKPDQILRNEAALKQHSLNAVMMTGDTVFGRLVSVETDQLTLKDTRDHPHTIALTDLYELVYDDRTGIVPPSRHASI